MIADQVVALPILYRLAQLAIDIVVVLHEQAAGIMRQRDHALVVEVGAGHVDQLGGLLLDGLDDLRMTVAGGGDGDAGGEVEELVAVHVFDPGAAAPFGYQRIATCVGGGDPTVVGFHDGARFGSGQWSGDAGGEGGSLAVLSDAMV